MIVPAFISFVVATVLGLVAALEKELLGNDFMWAAFFGFLGFALVHLPPIRRGP